MDALSVILLAALAVVGITGMLTALSRPILATDSRELNLANRVSIGLEFLAAVALLLAIVSRLLGFSTLQMYSATFATFMAGVYVAEFIWHGRENGEDTWWALLPAAIGVATFATLLWPALPK